MEHSFVNNNAEQANKALAKYDNFHDDYISGIEIRFGNYKALNDKNESTGIADARKTIILYININPYGKEHNQIIQMKLIDVKSFDISTPEGTGNMWGIGQIWATNEGDNIKIGVDFVAGYAKFNVVCSKVQLS